MSDILCRGAVVSSIQSNSNTLTRNASMRGADTGDYDVPHPHPYTHHYMSTASAAVTPRAMSMVGSRPGSAGAGSGGSAGSSGGGGIGGGGGGGCMSGGSCGGGGGDAASIVSSVLPQSELCGMSGAGSMSGGMAGVGMMGSMMGGINYLECMHYERMPLPVPLPIVPPPMMLHSEDEVEPAYATGIFDGAFAT